MVQRRTRSDAVRNHAVLLAAAEAAFTEHGTAASLSAVAARAGVSIGTLYKHFPTRTALIGALLAQRHDALFADAETLTGDDLTQWLTRLVAHAATYRGLAEVLITRGDDSATETGAPDPGDPEPGAPGTRLAADCKRMAAITDQLIRQARAQGHLRADTTAEDLLALVGAAAWVREQHGPQRGNRILYAALRGLTNEA